MKKGTKHSEETRASIAERTRISLAEKTHPVNSLRARLEASDREIQRLREELDELKAWRARITASVEKHRAGLERVAEKGGPSGEMCRDILESIGS